LLGCIILATCDSKIAQAQETTNSVGRSFDRLPTLSQSITGVSTGGVLDAGLEPTLSPGITTFSTSSPEAFDTGTVINNGTQTSGGITATYDFFTAGGAFDTTEAGSTISTGEPFPGDPDFTIVASFSDTTDGNATTGGAPTTSTQTPDNVSLNNYVVHGFSFSEPVDLIDFRIGDLDFDHDDIGGVEDDDYHDAVALVIESPDGTLSSITAPGSGVGSNVETYDASINADPNFSGNSRLAIPDFSASGLTDLVPYRNSDNANTGAPNFLPSDDLTAVSYGVVTNVTSFYVLYWSERNPLGGADTSDLQGIAIDATFLAASTTAVPFKLSTSTLFMGLLPFLFLRCYKRRRLRNKIVNQGSVGSGR